MQFPEESPSEAAMAGADQLDLEIRRSIRSWERSNRTNERALFRICTAAYSLAQLCEDNPGLARHYRENNFHTVTNVIVYLQDTAQPEFLGAGLKLATAIRVETENGGISAAILDERIGYYEAAKETLAARKTGNPDHPKGGPANG